MSNYYVANAKFLEQQTHFNQKLKDKFAQNKLEWDKLGEPVLWCETSQIISILKIFQHEFEFDFLSDVTAYDNEDEADGAKRFVVVYQIYSINQKTRIRIKVALDINEEIPSIVELWPAANWLEREVFDMYGIRFANHPNLTRILMDQRFTGFPLRKEYPIKLREPFADNIKINLPTFKPSNREI